MPNILPAIQFSAHWNPEKNKKKKKWVETVRNQKNELINKFFGWLRTTLLLSLCVSQSLSSLCAPNTLFIHIKSVQPKFLISFRFFFFCRWSIVCKTLSTTHLVSEILIITDYECIYIYNLNWFLISSGWMAGWLTYAHKMVLQKIPFFTTRITKLIWRSIRFCCASLSSRLNDRMTTVSARRYGHGQTHSPTYTTRAQQKHDTLHTIPDMQIENLEKK